MPTVLATRADCLAELTAIERLLDDDLDLDPFEVEERLERVIEAVEAMRVTSYA